MGVVIQVKLISSISRMLLSFVGSVGHPRSIGKSETITLGS